MTDDRKLSLSGRGKLSAGGSSGDSGQVRQSFSHGRSKPVVVERKRRRVVKKGEEAAPVAAPQPVVAAPKPRPAAPAPRRDERLSANERAARAEALKDAIRVADQERMKAVEGKRVRDEKARFDAEEMAKLKAEETAKKKAEDATRLKAEEESQKRAEEEERKAAAAAKAAAAPAAKAADKGPAQPPAKPDAAPRRGKEKEKAKKDAPRPNRRGGDHRRGGKLTVTSALSGGRERQRSLAAFRRAQAKKRGGGVQQPQEKQVRDVVVPEEITVQELANRMAEKAAAVIRVLMGMGVMATINETIDQDTAELVVAELGHTITRISESDVEEGLVGEEDAPELLKSRAPVVTIMGHVDHGKTSLLDALRTTDVVAGEAGGITQHIGAYQVTLDSGSKITFLDTPGHAAFSQMRARGASVTDIVVIVVAADDGLMPQTIEAINHAKAAEVPIIVAINKMDKDGADPARIRQDLLQHEVIVEAFKGDVMDVELSAKNRTNLDKLEEAILLVAEMQDLKANPDRSAEGAVIESRLDKGRGPIASVLIQRGTLRVGDIFVAGSESGRVRALIDDHGRQIKEALPGQPVEVLGLKGTPSAGDHFAVVENEQRAREVTEYRQSEKLKKRVSKPATTIEDMFSDLQAQKAEVFPIVLKADVQGSVEAITAALENLGNEDVSCRVIHGAAGAITESDVALAKASNAPIMGFNVRANKQAKGIIDREGVGLHYYSIIYDLIDYVKDVLEGKLSPHVAENIIGMAEVREVFKAGKDGKAAGCLVTEGVVRANHKARILREDVVMFEGGILGLRRFKDDVKEVKSGVECGMTLEGFTDVKPGDTIEVYELIETKRTL